MGQRIAKALAASFVLASAFACQTAAQRPAAAPGAGNLVANGGFEEDGKPARDWTQDTASTGHKGSISRDTARVRSGSASLRLQPNRSNDPPQQLAVAQELALGPYRGKPVVVSAAMRTEGEALAVAGLIVAGKGGVRLLQLAPVRGAEWTLQTRTFTVPEDDPARYFIALWVDGHAGAAWFDDVSVAAPGAAAPAAQSDSTGGDLAPAQPPPYDAWNPPLAGPVQNLALAEGWTDARLVAAPVNVPGRGGWTDSVTVSRDGRRLYFGYTKWDYFTFESSQKFSTTGRDRTPAYSGNELQIFQADLTPTGWTVSHHPVNATSKLSMASMGLNSREDAMVFNTYQFSPGYRTTMRLATRAGGSWSDAGALPPPINSSAGCLDDNGYIVGTLAGGATLYFESTRRKLDGSSCGKERHLYFASYRDGAWSGVQEVAGVNSTGKGDSDMQPFLSEDLSRIYWLGSRPSQGKYGLFAADGNGRSFANARMVVGIRTFTKPWAGKVVRIGEPNVAVLPQGMVMYFMCGIAEGDTWRGEPDNIQYRVCFARKPK